MGAVHLVVRGSVQGVGFRYFTRKTAQRCGVGGWVRNCDDGGVEIAASGDDASLQSFLAIIQRGPPGSHIAALEYLTVENPDEHTSTFSIRR